MEYNLDTSRWKHWFAHPFSSAAQKYTSTVPFVIVAKDNITPPILANLYILEFQYFPFLLPTKGG